MLNWKVVTQSFASFSAISFVLCVGYGLLVPAAFHPAWLLEALLPGFKWLSLGSFVLGLIESALYGAVAGALYSPALQLFRPPRGPRGRAPGHRHAGGPEDIMKKTRRLLLSGTGAIAIAMVLAANSVAVEPTLSREDRRGGVTVTATLLPSVTADGPLRVKVVLDTHSVGLDDLAFERIVALRAPDGSDVTPVAIEEAKGSGHHREAVVVFGGSHNPVLIVVKNVAGVAERSFSWELPAAIGG